MNTMKKQITITALLILALLFASCATTDKAQETAAVNGTVFDIALDGVPSSYTDFVGKGGSYFVKGPEEALGPDAEDGWKQKCLVGLREKGDYVYIIKYLENDEASAVEYIDIYKPNSDLPLSRYIGKNKSAVLADYPLGAGIDDRDFGYDLQYDAEDMTIQFMLKKGKKVGQVRVKPKKTADIGKRYQKISADWWGEQAAEPQSVVVSRNGSEVTATKNGVAKDRTDPTAFLAAFFVSYFSQDGEWKECVADLGGKEERIAIFEEAFAEFYGRADSISVTIDPAKFRDNGGGFAFFTVNIAYSYNGDSGADADQVTLVQDARSGWLVAELPM